MELNTNKGLTGLRNIGNSCYINSCLQILSNLKDFNKLLDNIENIKLNNNDDSIILKEWNNLRTMMQNNNCIIAPYRFINIIQKYAKNNNKIIFSDFSQNDVSEFFLFIIDCFHNSLKRPVKMRIVGEEKNKKDNLAVECFGVLKELYSKEYSEIIELFYGISVTQLCSIENNSLSCVWVSFLCLKILE